MVTDVGREVFRLRCRFLIIWSKEMCVIVIALIVGASNSTYKKYHSRYKFVGISEGLISEPPSDRLILAKVMSYGNNTDYYVQKEQYREQRHEF